MFKQFCSSLILFFLIHSAIFAQTDSSGLADQNRKRYVADSLKKAEQKIIKHKQDSLTFLWIKSPDPNRPNKFLDSLINLYEVKNLDFAGWTKKFPQKINSNKPGTPLPKGEMWIALSVLLLILFFAVIKNVFQKQLLTVISAFYSKRILVQVSKEDNLYNSWPFIFMYLLFGLTLGLFLYLLDLSTGAEFPFQGLDGFLILSLIVTILFTAKILVLRFLGFLFNLQKPIREYVSILYLSYFNTALIFLPLVVALALTPYRYIYIYMYLAIFAIGIVFVFQFIRAGISILSSYQFPKIYLFIYLCALEICPLLILIKALRF